MDIHLTIAVLGVFIPSCKSLLPYSYSLITPYVYHYPDLSNCHIFYHFDEILLKPKSCGQYMMFNPIKKVCDWPETVAQIRPECQQKPIMKYPANPERAYPKSRFRKNRRISWNPNYSQSSLQNYEDNTVDKVKQVLTVSEKLAITNKSPENERSSHYDRTQENSYLSKIPYVKSYSSNDIDNEVTSSERTKDGSYSYNVVLGKSLSEDKIFEKKPSLNAQSSSFKTSQNNSVSTNKTLKDLSTYKGERKTKDVELKVEKDRKREHKSKTPGKPNTNIVSNSSKHPTKVDLENISRLVSSKLKEQILLALKPALSMRTNVPVPDVRNLSSEDKMNLNKLTSTIEMDTKKFDVQTAVPNKVENKKDGSGVKTQRKIYIKTFPHHKNQLDCKTRKCVRKKVFRRVSKKFINEEKEKLLRKRIQLATSKRPSYELLKVSNIIGCYEEEFNSDQKSGGMKDLTDVSPIDTKAITLNEAYEKILGETSSNKSDRPPAGHLLLDMMVKDLGERSNKVSIVEDSKKD